MSAVDKPASRKAIRMLSAATEPSGRGAVGWYASLVAPQPSTSAYAGAPRALANSGRSTTNTPAPSPSTRPLRAWSNGRLAAAGSDQPRARASALPNASANVGHSGASVQPHSTTSAAPARRIRIASPIDCPPAAHVVPTEEVYP